MFAFYFDFNIVILVIFHFGFEGRTLVLIASVPGHCLSFHFSCDEAYTRHVMKVEFNIFTNVVCHEKTCSLHMQLISTFFST